MPRSISALGISSPCEVSTKINQECAARSSFVTSTMLRHVENLTAVSPEQGLITCNK